MVLPGRLGGRVGRRRILFYENPSFSNEWGIFFASIGYYLLDFLRLIFVSDPAAALIHHRKFKTPPFDFPEIQTTVPAFRNAYSVYPE